MGLWFHRASGSAGDSNEDDRRGRYGRQPALDSGVCWRVYRHRSGSSGNSGTSLRRRFVPADSPEYSDDDRRSGSSVPGKEEGHGREGKEGYDRQRRTVLLRPDRRRGPGRNPAGSICYYPHGRWLSGRFPGHHHIRYTDQQQHRRSGILCPADCDPVQGYHWQKEEINEEKKEFGQKVNEVRNNFTNFYEEKKSEFETAILNEKLKSEAIDISLPSYNIVTGAPNILEKLVEDVEEVFMSMGYDVVDGPEIEEDKYNFEMLNIPKGHPARDAQDTFYLEGEEILLRSQTSPVQVRTMLKGEGKTPIRMICPGKTYRRDDDDATHSHQFMQIEGLLVDKDISLSDLKGTLDIICKNLFGNDVETRFHPSYYQFTEPSVEVDISCFNCKGHGCNICKSTGWITVAGAGLVHPNVLRMAGYDPKVWSGFAFGFGAERLAMLKYNINDCRVFYNTDLRETKTFDRKESE